MENTITLTFGDCAENHVGMQQLGERTDNGFSIKELEEIRDKCVKDGIECEYYNLNDYVDVECENASFLIIRKGVDYILKDINKTNVDLYMEQNSLKPDKKYFDVRRNKVLNKNARYNLCFSEIKQEADYENKKGKIVGYDEVLLTKYVKEHLKYFFNNKSMENLECEGNYYYDIKKCGIGFHGDAERKKVVGLRLGLSMAFHFNWFHNSKPIGKRVETILNSGDMYIMSEKATGFDWKKRSKITLRHAAGCKKFLTIKVKK